MEFLQQNPMSYNIGYDEFEGYNQKTGCIDFNEATWQKWFLMWVNKMPERYYAYIVKCDDDKPIGEVALRYDNERNAHCVSSTLASAFKNSEFKHL